MSINELKTAAAALVSCDEYQAARARIFPSKGSLEWHLRQSRARLIEAGALVLIAGRWHINPTAYDKVLMDQGTEAAQKRLAAA